MKYCRKWEKERTYLKLKWTRNEREKKDKPGGKRKTEIKEWKRKKRKEKEIKEKMGKKDKEKTVCRINKIENGKKKGHILN